MTCRRTVLWNFTQSGTEPVIARIWTKSNLSSGYCHVSLISSTTKRQLGGTDAGWMGERSMPITSADGYSSAKSLDRSWGWLHWKRAEDLTSPRCLCHIQHRVRATLVSVGSSCLPECIPGGYLRLERDGAFHQGFWGTSCDYSFPSDKSEVLDGVSYLISSASCWMSSLGALRNAQPKIWKTEWM